MCVLGGGEVGVKVCEGGGERGRGRGGGGGRVDVYVCVCAYKCGLLKVSVCVYIDVFVCLGVGFLALRSCLRLPPTSYKSVNIKLLTSLHARY